MELILVGAGCIVVSAVGLTIWTICQNYNEPAVRRCTIYERTKEDIAADLLEQMERSN